MYTVTQGQEALFRLFKTTVGCRLPASVELRDARKPTSPYVYSSPTVDVLQAGYHVIFIVDAPAAQYAVTFKDALGDVLMVDQLLVQDPS